MTDTLSQVERAMLWERMSGERLSDEARQRILDGGEFHPPTEQTEQTELRMAAIFRADLPLPPGKLAVQAGHAFLAAWRKASERDFLMANRYADGIQVKIVLLAPDLPALERIVAKAAQREVSAVLITDAARTVLTEPTVTVLGLGPMSKRDCNALTRGIEML